jgi:adenylate cyclase
LERVGAGSLDEQIAVDDPGEIGLLQVGFNDMVNGLRERRLLQDLFGRHVGEEVAQRALRDGVELGGELRDASVLMVDLIGSTALARRVGPEEVVSLLNTFFAAVVSAVATHGGWVNKFEGDAALCVFGVPDHLSDHPHRALRAALELRQDLNKLITEHPDLDAGIGVSCGRVVAGNIGSASRLEYTVIGDAVNEAARLADLAKDMAPRAAASGTVIDGADHPSGWRHDHDARLRGRDVDTRVFVPAEP